LDLRSIKSKPKNRRVTSAATTIDGPPGTLDNNPRKYTIPFTSDMLVDSLPNHRTMYIRGRSIVAIEVVVAELSMFKVELVHQRGF